MSSVTELCSEHQKLIEKLWKKVTHQHEMDKKEALSICEDFIETRETMSETDIRDALSSFNEEMSFHWDNALRLSLVGYVEALRQILEEAENNGIVLDLNLGAIDSEEAKEQHTKLFESFKAPKAKNLPSLLPKGKTVLQFQEENERLKKQMERAQKKFQEKIATLQQEMKDFPQDTSEVQHQEIERLKKEMEDRLANSAQFSNLKKIVTQKNQQIKQLRERLAKYESDEVPAGSDDDES